MNKNKAIKLYEKETGNKIPSCQIAYHEWYIKYVKWLEQQLNNNTEDKEEGKSIETVGAKIRGRLSPYAHVIGLGGLGEEELLMQSLVDKNSLHERMLSELIELSKECEIHPSDKWDKHGG